MAASVAASVLVTLAMGLVAWLGWRRWVGLDAGGRWIVGSVGTSLLGSLVSLGLVVARRPTRPVFEAQLLIETGLMVIGFASWQPRRVARRALIASVPVFALVWVGALTQGPAGPFAPVSAPIGHALKVGAAALTLIALVRAVGEQWTRHLWFWFAAAVMLIYGTEVVLDPLMEGIYRVRDDLVLAAFAFHQLASLAGYLMMARGLSALGSRGSALGVPTYRASLAGPGVDPGGRS